MNHFYNDASTFSKKLTKWLLISGLLVPMLALTALAQTPQYSVTGSVSGGNYFPMGAQNTPVEIHYMPNEITGATSGFITTIYLNRYSTTTSSSSYTTFTVKMAQTTQTSFSGTTYWTTGIQTVRTGSLTVPSGNSGTWFAIPLTTPFYYNPAQSLILQMCQTGYSTIWYVNFNNQTNTTRRIYNYSGGCTAATGAGSDYERYFLGIDLSSPYQNDAGISALLNPVNFCAGTEDLIVNLKNYGTNTLNNVTINWEYDGVTQTPINYNTPVPSLGDASITLGTRTFTSGVSHSLVAWTSSPNSTVDSLSANDTLTATLKPAISGTLTVGGASPNYPTLTAAVADMTTNGICGPVVLQIRSGTYSEQVSITDIPGASAINTVTIESESGNRADVTYSMAASSTSNNYVIAFSGCSYVTVRNITMTSSNANYCTCLLVQGNSEHCTVEDCDLIGSPNATTSTYGAIIYGPSGSSDNYFTLRGCNVENGSYSAYMYGSSTSSLEVGGVYENNNFTNYAYRGILFYYHDSPQFLNNTLSTSNTNYTYKYNMFMYYCYNAMRVIGNKIVNNGPFYMYGMYIYQNQGSASNYGIIANNMITLINNNSNYLYGMVAYYNSYTKWMFNTEYIKSNSTYYGLYSYYGNDVYLSNNIINYDGPGYVWYCGTPTAIAYSDYNVLTSNGSNWAYWNGVRNSLAALQAASNMDAHSISKLPEYANTNVGDLHLVGASEDDPALVGNMEPDITTDIDGEPRILPYRGADEACYITKNSVLYYLTDASGVQTPYINVPGTFGVHYYVSFPDFAANITITLEFYSIPGNTLTYTTSFTVQKQQGVTLDGLQLINVSNIPPGVYRVHTIFNTKNSCGGYRDYEPGDAAFMVLPPGQVPCIVWPGDVNNDGIVNYGDRKSLNTYIHDANLSPAWLTGPGRYRADAATDPLTYFRWEPQAAVPWQTPEGCYMDADGNGTVNSFDYIPIKLNWMHLHAGGSPKNDDQFSANTFDMSQNFPNPFGLASGNTSTQIRYSVPERSHVRIVVTNMLGREVATLVNDDVEAGVRTLTFDASNLSSGMYVAVASMQGKESGLRFSKTIRMNLSK